jgi:hypothetical protein
MPQVKSPEEFTEHAVSEVVQLLTVLYLVGYPAETQQAKPLANEKILQVVLERTSPIPNPSPVLEVHGEPFKGGW